MTHDHGSRRQLGARPGPTSTIAGTGRAGSITVWSLLLAGWLLGGAVPAATAVSSVADATGPVDFLYQIAQERRQAGLIDDAIHELRKVLLIDPWHESARRDLATLEAVKRAQLAQETVVRAPEVVVSTPRMQTPPERLRLTPWGHPERVPSEARDESRDATRAEAMQQGLERAQRQLPPRDQAMLEALTKVGAPAVQPQTMPAATERGWRPDDAKPGGEGEARGAVSAINERIAPLAISGELRTAAGITRDDVILQEANGDLNERNFRIFSGPFRYNTFDPRLFSRFRLNVDTAEETGWQLHANTTVDPWSFVGTTHKVNVVGATPTDQVDLQLKWWSPTNTAINETFFTAANGDSLATPEIEVSEGRTIKATVGSVFSNRFTIPSMEIDYAFQPIRWFWTGFRSEVMDVRVFPLALEDQALTSNDPLQLSNHHIYWEPSPWLDEWVPGRLNSGATPDDFTRGRWSDDLTFFTRDSDLTRLTALRGTSLQWSLTDSTHLQGGIASPKGLWQEYESVNSVVAMTRLTQGLGDHLTLGGLYTMRLGFREGKRDAENQVFSIDGALTPVEGTTLSGQVATSDSVQDHGNTLENDFGGAAYHGAIKTAWWGEGLTSRLFFTHMDDSFDPGLANYRETRKDQFWGRHLQLKRRLRLLEAVQPPGTLTWEDVEAFRIGDGVDIGRDAVGLRVTGSWWNQRWEPLFDVRNVHTTDGKYVETVLRNEHTLRPVSWLTGKALALYHHLPKTVAEIDPFMVNADTDRPFDNTAIVGDRDPSLQTYSLGGEVAPIDELALWLVWERTNDTTVGTGNFPRGLLDGSSFGTRDEEGHIVRFPTNFLFGQGFFPQPPYPFFDIYRAGVYFSPWDPIEFAVDLTRNEFEYAGQIDDNLTHIGFTAAWSPVKRLTLVSKYVASWAIDVATVNAVGGNEFESHHSAYGLLSWKVNDDADLIVEYGVSAIGAPDIIFSLDPQGDFYPTLDTEHLLRLYYSSRF